MSFYKHSVALDESKCKACINCLKSCPTEAIRIKDGHAVIDSRRCIDCGECIKKCPRKAKSSVADKFSELPFGKKFLIALPPPSLYGQFENLDDADYLLQGLLDIGFDYVYEVARAAELVTEYTRQYLKRDDIKKPRMMTGQYVPDEEHVQICLNCTKKNCKGYCSLMSKTTTGKKRQKKEAAL